LSMEDNVFAIVNDGKDAVVKQRVIDWVKQLHKHEMCSASIHDLLDLIMESILITDSKKRITAENLYEKLKILLEKAKEDKVYLLEPVPRKPKFGGQLPLCTAQDGPQTNAKRKQRAFGSASAAPPNTPRDLVGRIPGTPGIRRAQTLGGHAF